MIRLKFCGAAGTVTGSCSLIESEVGRFLVDCGLFQGNRTTQALNLGEFPFDPKQVDFLILTHAHIDHSGLLPKLVKGGFEGKIFCTDATGDLLQFMLPDSAYIQESNAERQSKKNERRGLPPVEPIYTKQNADEAIKRIEQQDYLEWFEPAKGVRARMFNAGHLLGSSSVEIEVADGSETMRLLFSGDLGPQEKAFHPQPEAPTGYDYIICESTYGDRDRDEYTLEARRAAMKKELVEALGQGGNVVIPSFAVERSQELLHDIAVLLDSGEIPDATVFLDSPLARKATEVFVKYAHEMEDIEVDPGKLFRHEKFRIVQSVEESKAVNNIKKGAIIISASGMCNAGRIKHHLKNNIFRSNCTVLFVGYQSPGTLGSIITGGAKQVRIHGKEYKVRANIRRLGNYSAHADQPELIDWILERGKVAGGLFLNHGEDDSRAELKRQIAEKGIDADLIHLPQFDQTFELSSNSAVAGAPPVKRAVATEPPEPRVEVDQLTHDWHNEYAEFMLELGDKLRGTPKAADRRKMLKDLRDALSP